MEREIQSSSAIQPNMQKAPSEYFQMALNDIREVTGIDITPDQEARLLIKSGKMCDLSGDWDQALEKYQQALEICEDDEIKAEALKQKGHIRSKRGEWSAALQVYEASLKILLRHENLNEVGNVYKDIGYNYFEIGNTAKA